MIEMPRLMSIAKTDEERAKATLRIERPDPPARKVKKLKPMGEASDSSSSGSSSGSGSSDSSSSDESSEESEEEEEDDGGGETTMSVYAGPSSSELQEAITGAALDLIGSDELPADTPLMDAGLDSLAAVEFQGMLAKQFPGLQLPATLIFDFPSVSGIATHMDSELRAAFVPVEIKKGGGGPKKVKKPKAPKKKKKKKKKKDSSSEEESSEEEEDDDDGGG